MSDTEMMLREAGQFLVDRLMELHFASSDPKEFLREFYGHVDPALGRFRAALASSLGGERDAVIEECAKVVEGFAKNASTPEMVGVFGAEEAQKAAGFATGIAAALRTLKSQPSDLGEGR